MLHIEYSQWWSIGLKSSARSTRYQDLKFIKKFLAIDTRIEPELVAKQYGFTVDIIEKYLNHLKKCPGAIGCYISHYKLWETISKLTTGPNIHHVVLEDDMIINNIKRLHKQGIKNDTPVVKLTPGIKTSTGAYCITSEGARLLLSKTNKTITHPIDRWMWSAVKPQMEHMFSQISAIKHHPDYLWQNRDLII